MEDFADGRLLYLNKGARVITLPIKIIRNNTTIIKLNNNVNYNEISKGRKKRQLREKSRIYPLKK